MNSAGRGAEAEDVGAASPFFRDDLLNIRGKGICLQIISYLCTQKRARTDDAAKIQQILNETIDSQALASSTSFLYPSEEIFIYKHLKVNIEMKRKDYQKPTMRVVKLQHRGILMASGTKAMRTDYGEANSAVDNTDGSETITDGQWVWN